MRKGPDDETVDCKGQYNIKENEIGWKIKYVAIKDIIRKVHCYYGWKLKYVSIRDTKGKYITIMDEN